MIDRVGHLSVSAQIYYPEIVLLRIYVSRDTRKVRYKGTYKGTYRGTYVCVALLQFSHMVVIGHLFV